MILFSRRDVCQFKLKKEKQDYLMKFQVHPTALLIN